MPGKKNNGKVWPGLQPILIILIGHRGVYTIESTWAVCSSSNLIAKSISGMDNLTPIFFYTMYSNKISTSHLSSCSL